MKIVADSCTETYLFTGNMPYYVFEIGDEVLLHGVSSREQEHHIFYRIHNWLASNQRENHDGRRDNFNSGERKLRFYVNSTEETKELFRLFKDEGFKVRGLDRGYLDGSMYGKKVLINPNTATDNSLDVLGTGTFDLFLRKKELPHFLEFLRVLSKKHGYKTLYYSKSKGLQYEGNERRNILIK